MNSVFSDIIGEVGRQCDGKAFGFFSAVSWSYSGMLGRGSLCSGRVVLER